MLNIRTRAVAETLTFDLMDADDQPLKGDDGKPCTCTVYGPGSRQYQGAQQRKSDKLMAKLAKGKTMGGEEQARVTAEFLADITASIDLAYDDLDGRDKLLAIFSDRSIGFIADQVSAKVGDWANFKSGSAKS
jgi:hypothetical protein